MRQVSKQLHRKESGLIQRFKENTEVITTKQFEGASPQKLVLTGFNNHPRIPIIEAVLETFHTDWNMPLQKERYALSR